MPTAVQSILPRLKSHMVERVFRSAQSVDLKNAYLDAEVVGPNHENDTHHVALATVAKADLIVSWNFKHIVHFDKIRKFNAVNLVVGYQPIDIRSPKEVV